jgi:hypothetical protein
MRHARIRNLRAILVATISAATSILIAATSVLANTTGGPFPK